MTGRLFRHDGTTWMPIDEPLDGYAHAPPTPQLPLASWVIPRSIGARVGDVVAWAEHAHRLLAPCPPDDAAVDALWQQVSLWMEPDDARAWMAGVEVWLGMRIESGREWPTP